MPDRQQIAHNVFFTLKDQSVEAKEAMVAECHKYLSGHPGVLYYAAGLLTPELERPVNDRAFDVALHVIFDSLESQNAYQVAERHLEFIAKNKEGWAQVRVFDSTVGGE
ncbi:Dabb family protein [Blastopirellula sp. J2-11]|uniref:Dabb family protein n=1 Tax=Blastopirellula sp. J2-11 TaxID=2943192 RepID=UPI0021C58A59|nr:Dabb family protein [Blastopirellula sp. J2-11]UUO05216.1 Dabb family protein [Blastopirellula sp. J2-11]